jgi:hypothetical protein
VRAVPEQRIQFRDVIGNQRAFVAHDVAQHLNQRVADKVLFYGS